MSRDAMDLSLIGRQARHNSERWFPDIHGLQSKLPLPAFYGLSLSGEVGEIANLIKKYYRGSITRRELDEKLWEEWADAFTYLMLLADEMEIDPLIAFEKKQAICEERWGEK